MSEIMGSALKNLLWVLAMVFVIAMIALLVVSTLMMIKQFIEWWNE